MTILQISISASILILTIVVIRAVMLNRLPKKVFLVLWGVALFRLLIPFNLPSQFSIYNLVSSVTSLMEIQNVNPAPNMGLIQAPIVATGDMVNAAPTPALLPFLIVWLIGMLSVALFFIIPHLRCRQGYKMALPIDNMALTQWQQEHPTKRAVQIKQFDRITAPLTYGILRPIVLLPRAMDYTDERQLQYVLAHEYTHIKRFDILVKWLLAASVCVHWFNPLVWVMFILASRDIEISCDETVVLTFGENMKSAYALALINLEEKKSGLNPLCGYFSKNAIEERIKAIMKLKKGTAFSLVLSLVLVLGTTAVFATSSTTESLSTHMYTYEARYQDALNPYLDVGVTFNKATNSVLFNGKPVRYLNDANRNLQYFTNDGVIDIVPLYKGDTCVGFSELEETAFLTNTAKLQEIYDVNAGAISRLSWNGEILFVF